jgi:hypothetical protein
VLPLTGIDVAAYRGLRKVRLEGLGRVNLFLGGTNTGKTSLLEVVSLLADPFDPLTWTHTANRREPSPFAALASSIVDRLRYLFPSTNEEPGEISIEATGSHSIESLIARVSLHRGMRPATELVDTEDEIEPQPVRTEEERNGVEIHVSAKLSDGLQQSLFPNRHAQRTFTVWEGEPLYGQSRRHRFPKIALRTVTPYDHWLRSPATRGLSEAVLSGEEIDVIKLISSIEPRIVDVRLIEKQREPMVFLRDRQAGFLPISSFGDGIRRIFSIALAVPRAKHGVLLVDEIETGLHVSMLRSVYGWLWQACQQFDVQLFATTHSLEAVDALLDSDTTDEEDTIAYQLLPGQGASNVRRIGETQLKRLRRERGLDIR